MREHAVQQNTGMEPKENQKLSKKFDFVTSNEQDKSLESTLIKEQHSENCIGVLTSYQFIYEAAQSEKNVSLKSNSACSASDLLKFGIKHYCSILQDFHNHTSKQ